MAKMIQDILSETIENNSKSMFYTAAAKSPDFMLVICV